MHQAPSSRVRVQLLRLLAALVMLLVACTGPETGNDADPTPTSTAIATPTMTLTATQTTAPTATVTSTVEPTATQAASPTAAATATTAASPSPGTSDLKTTLPALADLPGQGYIIAEEGTRTGEELARAYADPAAHQKRLDEWGFKRHVFRAFSRDASGPDDPLPHEILATVNEYGSPEQAEAAVQWLRRLATSQGATEVDPPRLGDNVVAVTLPTAAGDPTASVYVRHGAFVYIYFAQGGEPLGVVQGIAQKVFQRR